MLTVEKFDDCPRCGRPLSQRGYDLQMCGQLLPGRPRKGSEGLCQWGIRRTHASSGKHRPAQIMVSLGGRSMNMAAAAKELGVPSGTIYARMRSHDLSQQEVVDYYTARSGEG